METRRVAVPFKIGTWLVAVGVLAAGVGRVTAFGAGSIPNYAYLNDKAFRHGDIAEALLGLTKDLGPGAGAGGGLLGIIVAALFSLVVGRRVDDADADPNAACGVGGNAGHGVKFTRMDMKRVYFGNWLRDYSQAMDIAALKKLPAQSIVTLVSILSFMTFGFATVEFEVTAERLGVYLPVEHIDNPKGYGENEGDARQFHSGLRPPVDPRELEINLHNGMKNYIATEGEAWDTSSACIRRCLQKCITLGRQAREVKGEDNAKQWEAYRLLGAALHTLEDLLAHSNWCELALRKLGHEDVFCHVGDAVLIDTPCGRAPPLVTGTFGVADFMHSLLGEGKDRLSESTTTELVAQMDEARGKSDDHLFLIKALLSRFFTSGHAAHHHEKMERVEKIKSQADGFNVDDVAPEEVQSLVWHVLEWRDALYRDVLKKVDMVPGMSEFLEETMDALNAFVLSVLGPFLKPLLQIATDILQAGSETVIDTANHYEVFDNPDASDPSHSLLAKDHFELILNEPAGKVARVVVEYTVNMVVKAWCDERENADSVIDGILEVLHHPYFSVSSSDIQRQMIDRLKSWLTSLGPKNLQKTLECLTKESIREGKNKRFPLEAEVEPEVPKGLGDERQQRPDTDASGLHIPDNVASEPQRTGDRGIRYEIRRGRPVFKRFDGRHQRKDEQLGRSDDIDESWHDPNDPYAGMERDKVPRKIEISDEEFWKNPYANPRRRYSQAPYLDDAELFLYMENQYSLDRTIRSWGNIYAPTSLMAEAESGFRAGLGLISSEEAQNEKPWRQLSRRYTRGSVFRESAEKIPSYEELDFEVITMPRPVRLTEGHAGNGGGGSRDKGKSRDDSWPGPDVKRHQSVHRRGTSSVLKGYDSSAIRSGSRINTTRGSDDHHPQGPPASFPRTGSPDGISQWGSDSFEPQDEVSDGDKHDTGYGYGVGIQGDKKQHTSDAPEIDKVKKD